MRKLRSATVPVWLALSVLAAGPAIAQDKQKAAPAKPPAQQQAQQAMPQSAVPPDHFKLNLLIRTTIIALNQANQTGNYTVLADLSAPAFRAANDSARLAQIFAALRQRQLDFSPVLFFTPKLVAAPAIVQNGLLRLVGYFPTSPERVNFDLVYQQIEGQWRLYGIGVSTSPNTDVTAAIPQAGQPPSETANAAAAPQQQAAPKAAVAPSAIPPAEPPKSAQKRELAPPPERKPQADRQSSAPRPGSGTTGTVVQNGTTNNVARIDLATPDAPPAEEDAAKAKETGFWNGFNLFGSD